MKHCFSYDEYIQIRIQLYFNRSLKPQALKAVSLIEFLSPMNRIQWKAQFEISIPIVFMIETVKLNDMK